MPCEANEVIPLCKEGVHLKIWLAVDGLSKVLEISPSL
jgi:hypothetical protein